MHYSVVFTADKLKIRVTTDNFWICGDGSKPMYFPHFHMSGGKTIHEPAIVGYLLGTRVFTHNHL